MKIKIGDVLESPHVGKRIALVVSETVYAGEKAFTLAWLDGEEAGMTFTTFAQRLLDWKPVDG